MSIEATFVVSGGRLETWTRYGAYTMPLVHKMPDAKIGTFLLPDCYGPKEISFDLGDEVFDSTSLRALRRDVYGWVKAVGGQREPVFRRLRRWHYQFVSWMNSY